MEAHDYSVNRDQRSGDLNTGCEDYRITILPGAVGRSLDQAAAMNENEIKIAIPSPFMISTTSTTHQAALANLQIPSDPPPPPPLMISSTSSDTSTHNQAAVANHDHHHHHALQNIDEIIMSQPNNNRDRRPNRRLSDEHGHYDQCDDKVCAQVSTMVAFIVVVLVGLFVMGVFIYHSDHAPYHLEKVDGEYEIEMWTKEYGIEFYVRSYDKFNHKYPEGTPARAQIENTIIADYFQTAYKACSRELWQRSTNSDFPTPQCDKLRSMGKL